MDLWTVTGYIKGYGRIQQQRLRPGQAPISQHA